MSSEMGLFALMLAPVLSVISAYLTFEMFSLLAQWFKV